MMVVKVVGVVVIAAVWGLMVPGIVAQTEALRQAQGAMTLAEFLLWAGTSVGINAIVGFLLSFVVEWWPAYESWAARKKRLVMMGLCFVVPLGALGGRLLLGEAVLSSDTVWWALLAGFTAFFGSQAADARNRATVPQAEIDKYKEMFAEVAAVAMARKGLGRDESRPYVDVGAGKNPPQSPRGRGDGE